MAPARPSFMLAPRLPPARLKPDDHRHPRLSVLHKLTVNVLF
ncbi:hypothetical protein MTBUT4_20009 [Magnetospirillum sp. UT-4]|nr:hypothetical protein MTBUT4_20009 [Magnetospirillum sp. UT-4]